MTATRRSIASILLDEAEEMGDMLRLGVGSDAMAQIEDVRPFGEIVQDLSDAILKRSAADHQQLWIKIALHRHDPIDLRSKRRSASGCVQT
jgi:phosphopantetheine adenylyltransferase